MTRLATSNPALLHSELAVACKRLRLPALAAALAGTKTAHQGRLTWLRDLLSAEIHARQTSALRRRLDKANLPSPLSTLADVDLRRVNATKAHVRRWSNADWVGEGRNLVVTGKAGTVRDALVGALGHAAASRGFTVRFYTVADLLDAWYEAALASRSRTFQDQLSAPDLLILDGWGVRALQEGDDEVLHTALWGRLRQQRSILIGACIPASQWLPWLRDTPCADELAQRLTVPAEFIDAT